MTQLFRSLIFVPGNNLRFLEKAKKLQADIVCFDLEDSVPDDEKTSARKLIKNALKSRSEYSSSIFVRTNDEPMCQVVSMGTHFVWHILNALMLAWMIEVLRRHMLAGHLIER